jgi:hypothetical protein
MDELETFRALVLADAGLQQQLLAAEATQMFVELASCLARERGLDISPTEFLWALQEARGSWSQRVVV